MKDPDSPATERQLARLEWAAKELGSSLPSRLTKGEASKLINSWFGDDDDLEERWEAEKLRREEEQIASEDAETERWIKKDDEMKEPPFLGGQQQPQVIYVQAAPPKRGMGCLGLLGLVFLGLMFVGFVATQVETPPPRQAPAARSSQVVAQTVRQPVADVPNPGRIAATSLYRAYDANEVSADINYKGKLAIVTGQVTRISKDILGTPYVVLKGGELWGVQCMFPRNDTSLARVRVGQQLAVRGVIQGKMASVLLRDCQIE